jgi:hypothetical protein
VIGWIFLAVFVVLFVVSLTLRRHGESDRPRDGWRSTDELFKDPSTGRTIRVWIDPEDGSRHYVPERR